MKRLLTLMTAVMLMLVMIVPAMAAGVGVRLPVTVRVSGKTPATAEYVSIVMTAEDASAPMPEGAQDGSYPLRMRAGSVSAFPEIIYNAPGTWTYTIRQRRGNVAGCTYDSSLFVVEVCIAPGDDGLYPVIVVQENEGTTKLDGIVFRNTYRDVTPTPVPAITPTLTPRVTVTSAPTQAPPATELPPTGVEDYWMLYLGGAALLLLLAALMLRILLRPEKDAASASASDDRGARNE